MPVNYLVLDSHSMKKLCFILFLAPITFAQDVPRTMNRMTVQLDDSEDPQDSFARKPKTIYRAGSTYCRVEEAADPERNIQGLLIVNEPDMWMVNLATKTAQHIVDPGPTFNCHLPIFSGPVPNTSDVVDYAKLGLEFGYELEYFKKMGAVRHDPGPVLQKQQTVAYFLDMNGTRFALFTYGPNEFPLLVAHTVGNKGEMFWYSGYGQVPFDPGLFAKPEGVTITEASR
jgi:hypothetical protein